MFETILIVGDWKYNLANISKNFMNLADRYSQGCSSHTFLIKQGPSENDGRSDVVILQSLRSFLTAVTQTPVTLVAVIPFVVILPKFT